MDNAIGYLILMNAWDHLLADIQVSGHSEAMEILSDAKIRVINDGIPHDQFALAIALHRVTSPFLKEAA